MRNVPHVRKAVKWNSPFYGVEGQGWFLNFHCFTKYIKVAFFRGTSLRPLPPGESKPKDVRYLDIHENGAPGPTAAGMQYLWQVFNRPELELKIFSEATGPLVAPIDIASCGVFRPRQPLAETDEATWGV